MAKFAFVQWLLEWLFDSRSFIFEWDNGNETKSKTKHEVTCDEAEEVFRNRNNVPLGIQISPRVSEARYGIIGLTKKGRPLFVSFTLRAGTVRVISTRPMSRKERRLYDQVCKKQKRL